MDFRLCVGVGSRALALALFKCPSFSYRTCPGFRISHIEFLAVVVLYAFCGMLFEPSESRYVFGYCPCASSTCLRC